jgi:hypothetical protein
MKSKIISSSLLVVGFLLGASALSAIAGTWTAPASNCTPPNCNVDAPVNVGTFSQVKTGLLGLNELIVESIQVLTSEGTTTSPVVGKVLTAIDNDGNVGWRSAGSGSGSISICRNDGTAVSGSATACSDARSTYGEGTSQYRAINCLARHLPTYPAPSYSNAVMSGSLYYDSGTASWRTQDFSATIACIDGTIMVMQLN